MYAQHLAWRWHIAGPIAQQRVSRIIPFEGGRSSDVHSPPCPLRFMKETRGALAWTGGACVLVTICP